MFIDIVSHSAELAPLGAACLPRSYGALTHIVSIGAINSASNEAALVITALFHRWACLVVTPSGRSSRFRSARSTSGIRAISI